MSGSQRRKEREAAAAQPPETVLVVAMVPAVHAEPAPPIMVPWHDPPRRGPDGEVIMRQVERGIPYGGYQVITARVPLALLLEHVEHVSEPDVKALQLAHVQRVLLGDEA